jgi:hypothetical protein
MRGRTGHSVDGVRCRNTCTRRCLFAPTGSVRLRTLPRVVVVQIAFITWVIGRLAVIRLVRAITLVWRRVGRAGQWQLCGEVGVRVPIANGVGAFVFNGVPGYTARDVTIGQVQCGSCHGRCTCGSSPLA